MKYDTTLRRQLLSLLKEGTRSISAMARELGVCHNTLSSCWPSGARSGGRPPVGRAAPHHHSVRHLKNLGHWLGSAFDLGAFRYVCLAAPSCRPDIRHRHAMIRAMNSQTLNTHSIAAMCQMLEVSRRGY